MNKFEIDSMMIGVRLAGIVALRDSTIRELNPPPALSRVHEKGRPTRPPFAVRDRVT
jgi:hypothetical protein